LTVFKIRSVFCAHKRKKTGYLIVVPRGDVVGEGGFFEPRMKISSLRLPSTYGGNVHPSFSVREICVGI
jgi:hypothetical protein